MMDHELLGQLDAELQHAGEQTVLSPQMLLLEQLRITPEKELPKMEFLFRLFGKPCFPRRELVAITGKAKSGKTYVTSMLMAEGVASPQPPPTGGGVLMRAGDTPLRVVWYDTEQSDESTQDILRNRIMKMATNLPSRTGGVGGGLDIFNVRCVDWRQRRALLREAVVRYRPDLVIVDGIQSPLPVEGGEKSHEERLPQLNAEYIVHDENGGWQFDVLKLFLDAMHGDAEVGGAELRKRVMDQANIVQFRKYNQLLKQAIEQKVIVKTERDNLTFYSPAPF